MKYRHTVVFGIFMDSIILSQKNAHSLSDGKYTEKRKPFSLDEIESNW